MTVISAAEASANTISLVLPQKSSFVGHAWTARSLSIPRSSAFNEIQFVAKVPEEASEEAQLVVSVLSVQHSPAFESPDAMRPLAF